MESAQQDSLLHKQLFGDHFIWGVSTAAFQIEGATNIDGKGVSIWDTFTKRKGKILNNDNAEIASDFYIRYKEDIDLLHQLNIPNFRFSISWTRVLPNGEGEVNPKGILFYNQIINYCLEKGIVPWITIYHWD